MYVYQMPYWERLAEYYYDNIHWKDHDSNPTSSLSKWIKEEYNGVVDWTSQKIYFDDPEHLTWFVIKWS